jgi:hypothetical protein
MEDEAVSPSALLESNRWKMMPHRENNAEHRHRLIQESQISSFARRRQSKKTIAARMMPSTRERCQSADILAKKKASWGHLSLSA